MLKVLVVDDDKLTRKGLIAAMPWKEHSMEVIGEAANGLDALKFLENNEVDLVLTDLEMPLMSGLEFIKEAIKRYPQLNFVVLTIHSDFEYIQQAFRLGAIDYIAKVQLDQENFSALLDRIVERFSKLVKEQSLAVQNWEQKICHTDTSYVLIALEDDIDILSIFEEVHCMFINAGNGVFLCVDCEDSHVSKILDLLTCESILLKLTGTLGMKYVSIYYSVMKYKKSVLFYEYDPNVHIVEYTIEDLVEDEKPISHDEFNKLKKSWLSLNWVRDPAVFDKICLDLKKSRLTPAQLLHIALAIESAWNYSYSDTTNQTVDVPPYFHNWKEIEAWLGEVHQKALLFQKNSRYSPEITEGVFKAKQIMEEEYATALYSFDVASRVNMSRSYFSQCFHDIVGISFSNYLRNVRIEKAQEYLRKTNNSIQWIAEQTGYVDEKYFSRIFKKTTNMIPSEYRKLHREI